MPVLLLVRIWFWRARPVLAALVAVAVLLTAVRVATAPQSPGTEVLVAARDVPAGAELTAGDLRLATLASPPSASGADPSGLLGRAVAVAVPEGLPLVPTLLAGERFAVDPPEGSVVLPVEVDAAALLRPGDRVDLLAPGCTPEGALAHAAVVVDQPDDRSVLVAVTSSEAQAVIGVRADCSLAAVVVT
ncbi:SAF domain-containing protein [Actinotalea sp. M2MS4P-6]|uniref:SAF domain-containing protein n=1 Tax=Actinotalea sp. M2MS4P-6 TaxID=2983762 RepID=UPI0021E4B064|nr:SAF domain-containing protein [Actinotalea sp. M2MS4P-6]MCV2395777.1 SAF domain-containing protein [Actinotalea sp. M2MS4P-6]